jgi:hypothetical protein
MDRILASERTRERLKSLIEGPWRGERFALRNGARCGPAYGSSNSPCCLEALDDGLGEFLGTRGHGSEHKLSRLRRLVG